ncbi:MAG: hypothetical protein ACLTS6_00465 [Anaerobutyricum sp.]
MDFHEINEKAYFGEITFIQLGFEGFKPKNGIQVG